MPSNPSVHSSPISKGNWHEMTSPFAFSIRAVQFAPTLAHNIGFVCCALLACQYIDIYDSTTWVMCVRIDDLHVCGIAIASMRLTSTLLVYTGILAVCCLLHTIELYMCTLFAQRSECYTHTKKCNQSERSVTIWQTEQCKRHGMKTENKKKKKEKTEYMKPVRG